MHNLRHLNRNATGQMAPDTIIVAVNLILLPAVRPPSARVAVVVAQIRGILPSVIRMIGQDRRGIAARTPPGQGHRVMHRDGVDVDYHTLDSTRIPHCPLFSDIMQGACQAQCCALRVFIFLYFPPFKVRFRPCIFALYQGYKIRAQSRRLSRMIRICCTLLSLGSVPRDRITCLNIWFIEDF
jgi:hypothetical protein